MPQRRSPGRPRDETLIARRHDQILTAATQVFAEQGYRQTDVQVVADRLQVGKGTIYRYFPTKEALFLAAVDRGMQKLKQQVQGARTRTDDPLEQISHAVCAYLAFFDDHGEILELIIQERAEFKDRKQSTYFVYHAAGLDPWRKIFSRLMQEGRIRIMPVDRLIDVCSDLMYGAIFTNRFAGRRRRFDEQAADILDVIFHGILIKQENLRPCPSKPPVAQTGLKTTPATATPQGNAHDTT